MHKILYVSHTSEIAGAEMSLLYILKDIDRKKFIPVTVLTENGPLAERLRNMGIKIYMTPLVNIKKKEPISAFFYFKTVLRLARIIKSEKVSLIHCNMYTSNQYATLAGFFTGVPLLCHIRNIIGRTCYYNNLLFLTKILIANSKATEQSYRKYLKDAQKSKVIYNSVLLNENNSAVSSSVFRQKYGIAKNAFLIGYIGQIQEVKGIHFLIEAVSCIAKSYPCIRLFVAGDDTLSKQSEYFPCLKKMCTTLNLNHIVIWGGFVNDTSALYSAIDVLVLPSTYEPFGRVLIEAMAAGKPVISTRVGGIPEVVEDGITGLLVPPEDPKALAKAIAELIDNPALARRFGEKGRERVEKYFNAKTNTRQLERIYNQIIERRMFS